MLLHIIIRRNIIFLGKKKLLNLELDEEEDISKNFSDKSINANTSEITTSSEKRINK